MIIRVLLLCMMFAVFTPIPARAQDQTAIAGYTLDGATLRYPQSLNAPATLIIVQFDALNEAAAQPWRAAAIKAGAAHMTFVVMGVRDRVARIAIGGRLRADAGPDAPRNAIAPLFLSATTVRTAFGLNGPGDTHVALVDRTGAVFFTASGAPDSQALTPIVAAIATRTAAPIKVASPPRQDPLAPVRAGIAATTPARPRAEIEAQPAAVAMNAAPSTTPPIPSRVAPAPDAFSGMTLAGAARAAPGDAAIVLLASSSDEIDALAAQLTAMDASGACAAGCLGLVAMGKDPRPTRAFAAGRLRAAVTTPALRSRIMPLYVSADALHQRFATVDGAGIEIAPLPR